MAFPARGDTTHPTNGPPAWGAAKRLGLGWGGGRKIRLGKGGNLLPRLASGEASAVLKERSSFNIAAAGGARPVGRPEAANCTYEFIITICAKNVCIFYKCGALVPGKCGALALAWANATKSHLRWGAQLRTQWAIVLVLMTQRKLTHESQLLVQKNLSD